MDVSFASGVVHAALTRPRGADGTENMATGFNTVTTRPRGRGRYGRGGWERQAGFALLRRAKGCGARGW